MHRTILFLSSALSAVFVLWLGSKLPDAVASHFGVSGAPDASLPRSTFVPLYALFCSCLPLFIWWLQDKAAQHGSVNIPKAAYWFSQPNAEATYRFISEQAAWFSVLLTTFLCFTFWLVFKANAPTTGPTAIQLNQLFVGLVVFLAGTAFWLHRLNAHFDRKDA